MKRSTNIVLLVLVVVLMAFPLWRIRKPAPGPNGKQAEIFRGADDQAKELIGTIAPGYKPWFKPIMEPPSDEVGSLLFALQAALGAGVIGYYLGASVTRAKNPREQDTKSRSSSAPIRIAGARYHRRPRLSSPLAGSSLPFSRALLSPPSL